MSAFIVSDAHLNYLVSFAARKRVNVYLGNFSLDAQNDEQRIFDALLGQNVRSVDARYGGTTEITNQKFRRALVNFDPIQVLKACSCYDYQACETDDYEKTVAYKIIDCIRATAIRCLPGYDDAAWEIRDAATVAEAKDA